MDTVTVFEIAVSLCWILPTLWLIRGETKKPPERK